MLNKALIFYTLHVQVLQPSLQEAKFTWAYKSMVNTNWSINWECRFNARPKFSFEHRFSANSCDYCKFCKCCRTLGNLQNTYHRLRTKNLRGFLEGYSWMTSGILPAKYAVNTPQTSQILEKSTGFARGVVPTSTSLGSWRIITENLSSANFATSARICRICGRCFIKWCGIIESTLQRR